MSKRTKTSGSAPNHSKSSNTQQADSFYDDNAVFQLEPVLERSAGINNDPMLSASDDDDSEIELVNTRRQIKPLPARALPAQKVKRASELDHAENQEPPKKRLKPKARVSDNISKSRKPQTSYANGQDASSDAEDALNATPPLQSSHKTPYESRSIRQLQQDLLNLQQQYDQLRLEKQAFEARSEVLENDLDSQRVQLDEQSSGMEKLRGKVTRLRDKAALLSGMNHTLSEKHQRVQGELDACRNQLEEALRQRKLALQRLKSQEDIDAIKGQLEAAQRQTVALETQCKDAQTEVQRLLSENFRARTAQQDLVARLQGKDREVERLRYQQDEERKNNEMEMHKIRAIQHRDHERLVALEKLLKDSQLQLARSQLSQPKQAAQTNTTATLSVKRPKQSSSPESSEDERRPAKRLQLDANRPTHQDVPPLDSKSGSTTPAASSDARRSVAPEQQPEASTSRLSDQALRKATAGQGAHKQGAFPMAVQLYTEALALGLEPEMALKVQYNRASANYECDKAKKTRSDLVLADCRELLSRKRDHYKAYRLLGRSFRLQGDMAESIKNLQLAVANCTGDSEAEVIFRRDTKAEIEEAQNTMKMEADRIAKEKNDREEREFAPMRHLDYWTFLGVRRNADQETIKKAIRRMWLRYHPDRGFGSNMKVVQKINAAKEFLLGSSAGDV